MFYNQDLKNNERKKKIVFENGQNFDGTLKKFKFLSNFANMFSKIKFF